ncbi:hypothetical protein, partial [uncultured Bilophila sp.]|uniref:hypothetical protein n=3 Tax=uncultured Bilophila sp. TaxID=529385 RepID=UPI00260E34EA
QSLTGAYEEPPAMPVGSFLCPQSPSISGERLSFYPLPTPSFLPPPLSYPHYLLPSSHLLLFLLIFALDSLEKHICRVFVEVGNLGQCSGVKILGLERRFLLMKPAWSEREFGFAIRTKKQQRALSSGGVPCLS